MFGFLRRRALPPVSGRSAAAIAADWRGRGNAALERSAFDEAVQAYRQAISADPQDAAAYVNLGYVLLEQENVAEAATVLTQAVSVAPSDLPLLADAHFLRARASVRLGEHDGAIASYQAALSARPGFEQAWQELVPLLIQSGRVEEALKVVQGVLVREPQHAGALDTRGNLLLTLGRPHEAIESFGEVLAVEGPQPDGLANMAAALLRVGRAVEALEAAETALRMRPDHPLALHAKGQALLQQLRVEEARDCTRHALELHPDDADLQWNLAVAHLLLGELELGWAAHEARWRARGFDRNVPPAFLAAQRWSGREPLRNRTILLFAEQGLGDTLQFLRFVPEVAARARQVLLYVPAAVAPLARSLASNVRVLGPADPLPPFELQAPLLSLAHAFGVTQDTVPGDVPYLQAETERAMVWADRLVDVTSPRVGIAWSGNPGHLNDYNRSIPLQLFRMLSNAPVRFVSLQPQVRRTDADAFSQWCGIIDAAPHLKDFADTAALVSCLDLVVTVDTSVAHLAGALGKRVWILLPFSPDWRWMLERTDTPWYPTARLYRQPRPGAWEPVLERVHADLQRLA